MGSPILDVKDLSISFSTSGAEVEAVKKILFRSEMVRLWVFLESLAQKKSASSILVWCHHLAGLLMVVSIFVMKI